MKFPKSKKEILEELYKENNAVKPRRSVSDLSGSYYLNELKEDRNDLDEVVEKKENKDGDKNKYVATEVEEE